MAEKRQRRVWKGLGSGERGRMEGRKGKGEVVRWLWSVNMFKRKNGNELETEERGRSKRRVEKRSRQVGRVKGNKERLRHTGVKGPNKAPTCSPTNSGPSSLSLSTDLVLENIHEY